MIFDEETTPDTGVETPEEVAAVDEAVEEEVAPAPEVEAVVEEPAAEPAPEVELGREAGNKETI